MVVKDLVGKSFYKLTVISQENTRYNRKIWKCQCECGNLAYVSTLHLTTGNTKSCGCLVHKRASTWTGYGSLSGCLWNKIKKSAEKRNINFDITIEQAWDLFIKQDKKCALSGVDLTMLANHTKLAHLCNASLDRIDSSKGYIEGNVQWVHKDINFMKMNLPEEKFKEYCSLIHNNVSQPKIGSHRYMVYS